MIKSTFNQFYKFTKWVRFFSRTSELSYNYSCKVLVVGGGAGGCAIASRLSRILKKDELIILEPSEDHYYQGSFTLCGAGIKEVRDTVRPMAKVLPKNATWLQDEADGFCPEYNRVFTCCGNEIEYDILVVATGLKIKWNKIPGLLDALENYDNVGTIYAPQYAEKTYDALENFDGGTMIFTHPHSQIKCGGASLKICYLIEDILRLRGVRSTACIFYHTAHPILFPIRHYEKTLWDLTKKRDINVDLLSNLVEVRPHRNEAIFEHTKSHEQYTQEYTILHVAPPMCTPDALFNCKQLVNKSGFVEVDKHTMQHVRYSNVFSIGDCAGTPNGKSAAACGSQSPVLLANIKSVLAGKDCTASYDGYSACPIVTGIGRCVLVESDYNCESKETLPIDQNRELWLTYFMKKEMMPRLYWNLLVKGYWGGPATIRKLLHLDFSRERSKNPVI